MSSIDVRWYWLASDERAVKPGMGVAHLRPVTTKGSLCGLWGPWLFESTARWAVYDQQCGTCMRIYKQRVIGAQIGESDGKG